MKQYLFGRTYGIQHRVLRLFLPHKFCKWNHFSFLLDHNLALKWMNTHGGTFHLREKYFHSWQHLNIKVNKLYRRASMKHVKYVCLSDDETHGFLREALPAWASNSDGLTYWQNTTKKTLNYFDPLCQKSRLTKKVPRYCSNYKIFQDPVYDPLAVSVKTMILDQWDNNDLY